MKTTLAYNRSKHTKDDTPHIAALVARLRDQETGGTIHLPAGDLVVNNLNVPGGITIAGVYGRTRLIAKESGPVLSHLGMSTDQRLFGLMLQGLILYGFGDTSPVLDIAHASYFVSQHCNYGNTLGSWIRANEVWDWRSINDSFTWGGHPSGSIAGLQLDSPGPDSTNQLMMLMPRFENYQGCALRTGGNNTNEIFISQAKFESGLSNVPHIDILNAVNVNLRDVQLTTGPNGDNTLETLVNIVNSQCVTAALTLECSGGGASSTRKINSYVKVRNSSNVDLNVKVYAGQPVPLCGQVIDSDGVNAATNDLNANGKAIAVQSKTQTTSTTAPGT